MCWHFVALHLSPHDQSFDVICYFITQNTVDDGLVMNLRGGGGGGGNVIDLVESDVESEMDDMKLGDNEIIVGGSGTSDDDSSGSDGSMDAKKKKKRHKLRLLQKKLNEYCKDVRYEIPSVELVKRALTMTGGNVDLAYEAILPELKRMPPTKKGKKKKQTVSTIHVDLI